MRLLLMDTDCDELVEQAVMENMMSIVRATAKIFFVKFPLLIRLFELAPFLKWPLISIALIDLLLCNILNP
jgi:hypothetical protein